MKKPQTMIVPYTDTYGPEIVQVWRDSMAEALGPESLIHSEENHLAFLNNALWPNYWVWVVMETMTKKMVGIMVNNDEEINQLYLAKNYWGLGMGSELVKRAKMSSSGTLRLYTFAKNKPAQKFYEKLGFKAIKRGNDNELGWDDILYEWREG